MPNHVTCLNNRYVLLHVCTLYQVIFTLNILHSSIFRLIKTVYQAHVKVFPGFLQSSGWMVNLEVNITRTQCQSMVSVWCRVFPTRGTAEVADFG